MSDTTNTNPGNFANRPTEQVKAIASMGGKASHKIDDKKGDAPEENHPPGRNADGTFVKGSEAAKEAGHLGGLHANGKVDEKIEGMTEGGQDHATGRNADGTFTTGSEAAKEAGHIGGLHSAGKNE